MHTEFCDANFLEIFTLDIEDIINSGTLPLQTLIVLLKSQQMEPLANINLELSQLLIKHVIHLVMEYKSTTDYTLTSNTFSSNYTDDAILVNIRIQLKKAPPVLHQLKKLLTQLKVLGKKNTDMLIILKEFYPCFNTEDSTPCFNLQNAKHFCRA